MELRAKLIELPVLQHNAQDALHRVSRDVPNAKILDFGCGWGFFLEVAKSNGWSCYGLEPLPGHSAYARSKFGLEILTGTLKDDSFPENHFDVITAFQVFEHLPDPAAVIRQLWKIQKADGLILIEVPNIDTWSVKLLRKHHRHFNPDHINFFSAQTIKLFLENNGYMLIETYFPTRYMTIYHLLDYWFRRIFRSRMANLLNQAILQRVPPDKQIGINLGDILGVVARKSI